VSGRIEYLLDTNVLFETRKKIADARVTSFLASVEPSTLYISVLTIGELRKGVMHKSLSDPQSARRIGEWVEGLELSFAERILGVDLATSRLWGELCGQRPRAAIDTLLAATAIRHGLTLVTRNMSDVQDISVNIFDPWKE
jgi:predicted nucleic acid-binding protein